MRTFRHAVSLDERRAKFKANLWNRPSAEEAKFGSKTKSASTTTATRATSSTSPAAAAGGLSPGLQVYQSTASFDDNPDSWHDAKDFILRKGFSPTNILPAGILLPSLHSSAKKTDAKDGDMLNDKSDKDNKTLNRNLNGHTKSQMGRGPKKEDTGDRQLNTLERIYSEKHEVMTDIEEVWFAVRVVFLSFLEWQR